MIMDEPMVDEDGFEVDVNLAHILKIFDMIIGRYVIDPIAVGNYHVFSYSWNN